MEISAGVIYLVPAMSALEPLRPLQPLRLESYTLQSQLQLRHRDTTTSLLLFPPPTSRQNARARSPKGLPEGRVHAKWAHPVGFWPSIDSFAELTQPSADTPSMYGRPPEDGTHSPQTGKGTQLWWELSCLAFAASPGRLARRLRSGQRCQRRANISPVGSKQHSGSSVFAET
jgi:hypothetical protein